MKIYQVIWIFGLLIFGCNKPQTSVSSDDKLLAEVYNYRLYESQVKDLLHGNGTKEDSIATVQSYIEKWVRESLIKHAAETNIPRDLDINQLVEDYRASLIQYHYEKNIVETRLDTFVSDEELQNYYDLNNTQFLLQEPLFIVDIAKFPDETSKLNTFNTDWKRNNTTRVEEFCKEFASFFFILNDQWITLSELAASFPISKTKTTRFRKNATYRVKHEGYEYFLKINDFKDKNDIPPLSYIKDQIIKIILHRRKSDILNQHTEDIYQQESKNIKIYND